MSEINLEDPLLFISSMPQSLGELLPFIDFSSKQYGCSSIVYLTNQNAAENFQISKCIEIGATIINKNGKKISSPNQDLNKSTFSILKKIPPKGIFRILSFFRNILLNQIYNPIPELFHLARLKTKTKSVLDKYKPKAIILGCDMVSDESPIIIAEAQKRRIPTITLTWIFGNGDDPANVYAYIPKYLSSNPLNKLLALFFPKWEYTYKEIKVVRLPAMQALTRELMGIAPPNPWVFNSGFSDAIIMECDEMYEYYLKAGLDSNKLYNIGSPRQDIIAKKLENRSSEREKLFGLYNFDISKRVLLCSLPPEYCFNLKKVSSSCEFSNYEELSTFWLNLAKNLKKKCNVLVTPHPSLSTEKRESLEKIFGLPFIKGQHTSEVIPLVDIFMTSISSTIRWAVACGVPVVDYDIYSLGGNQLGVVPGVICPKDSKDFEKALHKILDNDEYYSSLRNAQLKIIPRWGKLDGKSCLRLSTLINNLIAKKKK